MHAARLLRDDIEAGRIARVVVAFLDQQPLLLASLLPPAAHQRPAAVQLRAVEPERQLARAVAIARRAMPPSGVHVPSSHTVTEPAP